MSVAAISGKVNTPEIANSIFKAFPTLVSLSIREAKTRSGQPTGDALLVVGRLNGPVLGAQMAEFIAGLPALSASKASLTGAEFLEFTETPGTRQDSDRMRPAMGGVQIQHMGISGTLGCAVTLNRKEGYFLSSGHVIAGPPGLADVGDPIFQPEKDREITGRVSTNQIGSLLRWTQEARDARNEADVAIGEVSPPAADRLSGGVRTLGDPTRVAEPTEGSTVRFSGASTRDGVASVLDSRCLLVMSSGHVYINQIRLTRSTRGGDSGSAWLSDQNSALVGIHFAGTNRFSYANRADRAIELLNMQQVAVDTPTGTKSFEQVEIGLPTPRRTRTVPTTPKSESESESESYSNSGSASNSTEATMGSPTVNVYVYCNDKGPGTCSQPEGGGEVGTREGLPRFDRFRFFNGTSATGSGKALDTLKYTPMKASSAGTPIDLGALPDKAGVNHLNMEASAQDEKPDTLALRFTPKGMAEKKATLALANGLVTAGYYLRRATFELRSGLKLFADYVYGRLDANGNPEADLVDAEIELTVSNA